MRSREAWLALLTAVLGVDATGCRQEGPRASPAGSIEITGVPSATSVAAATPSSVASADVDASNPPDAALASGPGDAGKRPAAKLEDAGVDLGTLLASQQSSCGVSNFDLHASCGGTIRPNSGGLGSLRGPAVDAGPAPKGDATLTIVRGGAPSDARILAGLRPGMKACFNATLNQDPTAADGHVTLTVSITPNGQVDAVTPGTSTLPAQDVGCVSGRVRRTEFDPPGGTGRTVVIKVDQKKLP